MQHGAPWAASARLRGSFGPHQRGRPAGAASMQPASSLPRPGTGGGMGGGLSMGGGLGSRGGLTGYTAIGPDGEYTCRASYPSPRASLQLGRKNLHLFRARNTRWADTLRGSNILLAGVLAGAFTRV